MLGAGGGGHRVASGCVPLVGREVMAYDGDFDRPGRGS